MPQAVAQEEEEMVLGFLMIGMVGGVLAGTTALLLGQGFLVALGIYALTGIAGTVLGALAEMIPPYQMTGRDYAGSGSLIRKA